jgi:hypothetical protein
VRRSRTWVFPLDGGGWSRPGCPLGFHGRGADNLMSWAEQGAGGRCAGGATSVGTTVVAGTQADGSCANERTGGERSWPVPCCRPHLAECDQKLVRPPSPYFWIVHSNLTIANPRRHRSPGAGFGFRPLS